jgi:catechol 2,3-dioxygenase-like lactoylglutathione lyase family enzyme
MLNNRDAMPTLGVKDLKAAEKFYEETLGLKRIPGVEGALIYQSGKSTIMVYQSRYAGTNQATAVTWDLDTDVENVVRALAAKGAKFEHYNDLPDTKVEGDLHISHGRKLAWLKDPDGNILAFAGK